MWNPIHLSIIFHYRFRFARIGPVFYLANLGSWFLNGQGDVSTSSRWLYTLTLSNSWFSFLGPHTLAWDSPSWTISTLSLQYLLFPALLPCLVNLSRSARSSQQKK